MEAYTVLIIIKGDQKENTIYTLGKVIVGCQNITLQRP